MPVRRSIVGNVVPDVPRNAEDSVPYGRTILFQREVVFVPAEKSKSQKNPPVIFLRKMPAPLGRGPLRRK